MFAVSLDGTLLTWQRGGRALRDAAGRPVGLAEVDRDRTEVPLG